MMNTAPKIDTREMVLKLRWNIWGIGRPRGADPVGRKQTP